MSYDDSLGGFADGYTEFRDQSVGEHTARIVIQAKVGNNDSSVLTEFVVDTGAVWSILGPELADELGVQVEPEQHQLVVRGREWRGFLTRLPLTIQLMNGTLFRTSCTFWIPVEDEEAAWQNPSFIGYTGLLQHIRFAVDPVNGRNRFFVACP